MRIYYFYIGENYVKDFFFLRIMKWATSENVTKGLTYVKRH